MQWQPRSRRKKRRARIRWVRLFAVAFGAALIVTGAWQIIGYASEYLSSQQTAQKLRQAINSLPTNAPVALATPAATPAPIIAPSPTAGPPAVSPKAATAKPTPAASAEPKQVLPQAAYPLNPQLEMDNRFRHLRKESPDLVGWLTINTLLDEPVVQRDNVYYLTRDAMKKQNVNGAIFLDAAVSLRSRPYTLILYGHNIKTGAMFGNLRNFENGSYYRSNPFITFDTLYEEGRYVVFSAGVISTEEKVKNYVDFLSFFSPVVQERQSAIDALISASVHNCTVDVEPGDQLLLLVTCAEKDSERRVIAARRLRDGETEQGLKKQVEKSWKK